MRVSVGRMILLALALCNGIAKANSITVTFAVDVESQFDYATLANTVDFQPFTTTMTVMFDDGTTMVEQDANDTLVDYGNALIDSPLTATLPYGPSPGQIPGSSEVALANRNYGPSQQWSEYSTVQSEDSVLGSDTWAYSFELDSGSTFPLIQNLLLNRRANIRLLSHADILKLPMFLKILAHPVLGNLNFHMPMIVDLSHPLVMLTGDNGSGKSTLLHSIHYALRGEKAEGFAYKLDRGDVKKGKVFLFDAEQHNPRMQLEAFKDQPEMIEFLQLASHGQVMLAMFQQNFPALEAGTTLLLDEPEMALSISNQRRILKMLQQLVAERGFRIICATHSPVLIDAPETYVINLDNHVNRNVPLENFGQQGASTIQ